MTAKCLNCGYDLSGLDPSGRCPECAHPIAQSLADAVTPPESELARCTHTAVLTALVGVGIATALAPNAYWYFGPTEFDQLIPPLQLAVTFLGSVTSIIGAVRRRITARLILIMVLTALPIALWCLQLF